MEHGHRCFVSVLTATGVQFGTSEGKCRPGVAGEEAIKRKMFKKLTKIGKKSLQFSMLFTIIFKRLCEVPYET